PYFGLLLSGYVHRAPEKDKNCFPQRYSGIFPFREALTAGVCRIPLQKEVANGLLWATNLPQKPAFFLCILYAEAFVCRYVHQQTEFRNQVHWHLKNLNRVLPQI